MAGWVQGAIVAAQPYLASKTFAEILTFCSPQRLRSGNFVLVSPARSLSSSRSPTHFLTPWDEFELDPGLAFPGDPLPPHGNSLGPSSRTPQHSCPAARRRAALAPTRARCAAPHLLSRKGSAAKLERPRQKWSGGRGHDRGSAAATPRPVARVGVRRPCGGPGGAAERERRGAARRSPGRRCGSSAATARPSSCGTAAPPRTAPQRPATPRRARAPRARPPAPGLGNELRAAASPLLPT